MKLSRLCLQRSQAFLLSILFGLSVFAFAQGPAFSTRFSNATPHIPDAQTASHNLSFRAHHDYPAADLPGVFARGDLNQDGITDLVLPNNTPNFALVSVVLGNQDGSFQFPLFFDSGDIGTSAAVIADFNKDGKPDVAVTTLSGVSLLLGDGAGNLGAPQKFTAGSLPQALVAGDFNGDKKPDLAVANFNSNNVSILLGDGKGGFRNAATLTVGHAPLGIVKGDFNADGKLDLAVANSDVGGGNPGPDGNTVSILLGAGDGSFAPAVNLPVASRPLGLAIADLNHDSNQDIVVTNSATDQVSVLLGKGNGTFQTPATFSVVSGGQAPFNPSFVSVKDFNADGSPDLVVSNVTSSTIAVLLGDGLGGFGHPANIAVGRTPVAVLTGDFNHDGKPDFVTANRDGNTVSVVFGKGDGRFLDTSSFPASAGPVQVLSADFNHDGFADLATVDAGNSQDGHTVSIFLGRGSARFSGEKLFNVGNDPLSLAIGDFDKDGNDDIVTANFGKFPDQNGGISLLRGNGDGSFQPAVNFPAGDFPDFIAAADFNRDGKLDVAVADFGTNLGVGGISVLFGDGKGGFAKPVKVGPNVTNVFQVSTGDFNGDGNPDIAFSSRSDVDSVSVLLGKGDGTFGSAKTVAAPFFVFTFTTADFDHDGILDFAVEEGGLVEVLRGSGQGTFQSLGTFNEGEVANFSAVQSLAVGDFNGDGFADIAAPDVFSDSVSILLGNGDGTFGVGQLFAGAPGGRAVVADFDQDQRPDIALAGVSAQTLKGKLVLLLNRSR